MRDRRDRGIYYTPMTLARHLTNTLMGLSSRAANPRILDPACGNGRLLSCALRRLLHDAPPDDPVSRLRIVKQLYGTDIDRDAVVRTRRRLARLTLGSEQHAGFHKLLDELEHNIRWSDALIDTELTDPYAKLSEFPAPPINWQKAFPEVFSDANAGFDLIVTNPPFINVRRLAQQGPVRKHYFTQRYRCARGAYDQYILFIELCVMLLRQGGSFGMIVPNKWAVAEYAETCRQLLQSAGTMQRVEDIADRASFSAANVYPHLLYWSKKRSSEKIKSPPIAKWSIESRLPMIPLAKFARLFSGATGFMARQIADELVENSGEQNNARPFIVTGTIDRYRILNQPVRFMGRVLSKPLLSMDSALITAGKRQLYSQPKLVVAGLTRRLEVVYDSEGCALGVQTYAAIPASQEMFFLLGLLNSKLLTYMYRERYAAKRLGGGYIAINKRQLGELPIPVVEPDSFAQQELMQSITRGAQQLTQTYAQSDGDEQSTRGVEESVDEAVYQLYRLSNEEVNLVEREVA